jgi:hypothetical protein
VASHSLGYPVVTASSKVTPKPPLPVPSRSSSVAASTRSDGEGTDARARHRRRRYCAEPFSPIRVVPGVAFVLAGSDLAQCARAPFDPVGFGLQSEPNSLDLVFLSLDLMGFRDLVLTCRFDQWKSSLSHYHWPWSACGIWPKPAAVLARSDELLCLVGRSLGRHLI